MPSVEPQVTVISASGSTSSPRYHFVFSAMASRKSFAPQVIAYWFKSSAIASCAARLISAGAGKSGRSEEHTSELQSRSDLVCRLLLEKKKKKTQTTNHM